MTFLLLPKQQLSQKPTVPHPANGGKTGNDPIELYRHGRLVSRGEKKKKTWSGSDGAVGVELPDPFIPAKSCCLPPGIHDNRLKLEKPRSPDYTGG